MSKSEAYDGSKKLEVIEWIGDHAGGVPTRAAKKFKLPPVRTWWAKRTGLIEAPSGELRRKRLSGGGRRGIFSEYDDEIAGVILNLRTAKERVTRETVRHIAQEIARRVGIKEEDFKASDGWLTKFIFSFRRVTNLSTLTDETLLNRAFEYMKYLQHQRQK